MLNLAKIKGLDVTVLSLAEHLPAYTEFPSIERKNRLENILNQAANHEAASLAEKIREIGLVCNDSIILQGRYPIALVQWINDSTVDLVIKESLPSDGEFGFASKGDLKLTRASHVPILLVHSKIENGSPLVVGIPPNFEGSNDFFCIKLINNAAAWAKLLDAKLHLVHAWTLFGESSLR